MASVVDAPGTVALLEPTGESTSGQAMADIIVEGTPPCARCAEGRGCGAGIFTGRDGRQHVRLAVPRDVDIAVGDPVTVSMSGRSLLTASILAYGVPLLGLLAGALSAALFSASEGVALVLAGAGLAAGVAISRRRLARACWRADTSLRLAAPGQDT